MTRLHFKTDGSFKIVQFTDIHWHDGQAEDIRSLQLMRGILGQEQPDLIVFTGDLIHSELTASPSEAFIQAVSAATGSSIPWTFVFGNHDAEEGITRDALMMLAKQLPHCLAEAGPSLIHGVGNAFLPIYDSEQSGRIRTALYLFDSGSKAPDSIGGAAWIEHSQIEWYLEHSRQLQVTNGGTPVPALAFFHIPLPEYNDLWDFSIAYGINGEGVGCPRLNSGLFHAFRSRGDVSGVFVGHDHLNDYWGQLHGIRLCYGRYTGFNAYGQDGFPRGARIIQLNEDARHFSTWLHLEEGTIVHEQPKHEPAAQALWLQCKKRIVQ
ncbi:metallophosphoesterase family protein [Paenibacillus kobensis]|uniref:metallophosphoesterase family protein n=1 Tax=Paenibacillus kobensis TaxID=59841 RepID=UPI000FDCD309|nr:metallophosphoesterase family protein [Paenibacillus kobensis]